MSEGAHESPDTGAEQRPVDPVRLAAEMVHRDWWETAGPDAGVPTVEELLAAGRRSLPPITWGQPAAEEGAEPTLAEQRMQAEQRVQWAVGMSRAAEAALEPWLAQFRERLVAGQWPREADRWLTLHLVAEEWAALEAEAAKADLVATLIRGATQAPTMYVLTTVAETGRWNLADFLGVGSWLMLLYADAPADLPVVAEDQDAPPDGPLVSGQHRVDAMAAEMNGTEWQFTGPGIVFNTEGPLIDGVHAIADTTRGGRLEALDQSGSRWVVVLTATARDALQPWLGAYLAGVGFDHWHLESTGRIDVVLTHSQWTALQVQVRQHDLRVTRTDRFARVHFCVVFTADEPNPAELIDAGRPRTERDLRRLAGGEDSAEGTTVLLRVTGEDIRAVVETLDDELGLGVVEVDALGEPPVPVFEVRTARGMAEGYAASFANANQGEAPAPREPDSPTGNNPGFGWLAVLDWELKQALRWVGNVTGETEWIDGLTLLPVAPHTWPDLQRQAEAAGLVAHRQHWRAVVEHPGTPGHWKGFPVYRLVPARGPEHLGDRVVVLSGQMWPPVARFMNQYPALWPARDRTAPLAELSTTGRVSVSIVAACWPAFMLWAERDMGWTLTPDVDNPQVVDVADTREG